jgi:ectoine hydroxylase-related dioxygenase (phytanoyl-CoA dioxygenase family)
LKVLPRSHMEVKGYRSMQSQGSGDELPGEYRADSNAAGWVSAPANMKAGDLIIFNWKLIHAASAHKQHSLRLSLDTRIALHF